MGDSLKEDLSPGSKASSPRLLDLGKVQWKPRITYRVFLVYVVVQLALVAAARLNIYVVSTTSASRSRFWTSSTNSSSSRSFGELDGSIVTNFRRENTFPAPGTSEQVTFAPSISPSPRDWKIDWMEFPVVEVNETEQLLNQWQAVGSEECHGIKTQAVKVLNGSSEAFLFPTNNTTRIRLTAGPVYEVLFASMGEDGKQRCNGGDYFETDLSGPRWKSRPPVIDHNNGTYTMRLQMHPDFAGVYSLNMTLLFNNLQGLILRPEKWIRLKMVLNLQIEFVRAEVLLMEPAIASALDSGKSSRVLKDLTLCSPRDFKLKNWSGRWTRAKVYDCPVDSGGRYNCLNPKLMCKKPWCAGPLASLESNGWVYSAHCAFKIFKQQEAWKCLNNKWLFVWGDSNVGDTIRNLLNFVLGFNHTITAVDRRTDQVFYSPTDGNLSVRITSIFNGHHNASKNWEGLYSLHDDDHQQYLRSFFDNNSVPDFMIMNSGLHDGMYWRDTESYLRDGVEHALGFWGSIWDHMTGRKPKVIYRTTVTTAGRHRPLSVNPQKMEFYNHVVVDKLMKLYLPDLQIVDGFDLTFPWHYDNRCSDGVHYGRPPSGTKWVDGQIGHHYFVDLMLVHILLNSMCGA